MKSSINKPTLLSARVPLEKVTVGVTFHGRQLQYHEWIKWLYTVFPPWMPLYLHPRTWFVSGCHIAFQCLPAAPGTYFSTLSLCWHLPAQSILRGSPQTWEAKNTRVVGPVLLLLPHHTGKPFLRQVLPLHCGLQTGHMWNRPEQAPRGGAKWSAAAAPPPASVTQLNEE